MLRRAGIVFAAAFFLCALITTGLWESSGWDLSAASYSLKRAKDGFAGIDLDSVRANLDARLPAQAPVWFDPQLEQSEFVIRNRDFFVQRLTEALYPRLVEPGAGNSIKPSDLRIATSQMPPSLASTGSFWGGLDAFFALALLGTLAYWTTRRWLALRRDEFDLSMIAPVFVLLGALVVALKTSVQTWLQIPWRGIFPGFGFLLLLLVIPSVRRRLDWPRFAADIKVSPERLVLAIYLVTVAMRAWLNPIVMWDSRSIWFFAAHRLYQHGMLAISDLTNAATSWSHPDYPLLYSSLASFFSSSTAAFSERMAALCIPALSLATLSLLWGLSRRALGRWPGCLFTLGVALFTDRLAVGGYVDGFVIQLLLIEVLASCIDGTRAIAWLAAGCASLLKDEGLVLAAAIALIVELRRKQERPWRRAMGFLVFGPAIIHHVWVARLGANSLARNASLGDVVMAFFPRFGQAVVEMPKLLITVTYTQVQPVLWSGVVAFVLAIGLLLRLRSRTPWPARLAMLAGLMTTAFSLSVISAIPRDILWLVWTALDRLLVHASLLFALSALLVARGFETDCTSGLTGEGTESLGKRSS